MKIQKKNLAGQVDFQYEGVVLRREAAAIVLEAFFGREEMVLVDVVLKKGDRFVETFYTDRWYNVFEVYDRDSKMLKGWYCNIGLPAIIEEDVVSYVDLALDLWVAPDGKQSVLDRDEFEGLNLEHDLKQKAGDSLLELQERFRSHNPPY